MTAPVHISPRIEILVRNGHLEPYKDEILLVPRPWGLISFIFPPFIFAFYYNFAF